MHSIRDLCDAMERLAPPRFAADWDNVGLLIGDPDATLSRVLLTIDLTSDVYREARALEANAVVSYHPPLFKPVSKVLRGSIAFDAARDGVAIYSPHTALDAAPGGTNDVLADAVGISREERRGIEVGAPKDAHYKLVTFVPEDAVTKVSDALFDAGAGRIGAYSHCSFRVRGQGTFFGDPAQSAPTIGQAGRLETVDEVRIEVLVPISRLDDVLRAHRRAHPYETPAFDLVRLAREPEHLGYGRIGPLTQPAPLEAVIDRLKRALSVQHLLVAGPTDRLVRTAAVGAGATGELLSAVLRAKADLFVLGEMRHHDALRAASQGTTVVMTLHSNSERATLEIVRRHLEQALSGVTVHLSAHDRDPFAVR
jgi:dinuclear metal center YbgI/SA1388 family protein